MREELHLKKKGTKPSAGGKRLGFQYSKHRAYEVRLAKQNLCKMKALVCQLKIIRPMLREAAAECGNWADVLKRCNNIILAHKTKALGGHATFWDFLVDFGNNKIRSRYNTNIVAFPQTVKLYDLFSLNLSGSSLSTVKLPNKNGVQFVGRFRPKIFTAMVSIYKNVIEAYGWVWPIPIFMAEDETKIKTRVSWESRSDTLTWFCRRMDVHVREPG